MMAAQRVRSTPNPEALAAIETLPPPERGRHDPIAVGQRSETDEAGRVTGVSYGARVFTRSTVERLYWQDKISRPQLDAARRLYSAWYRGGLSHPVTLSLTRLHAKGGRGDLTEKQITAREAFNAAMRALPAEATDLVYDIVCADLTPAQVAFSRGWGRPAKAIQWLRVALDELARHWEGVDRLRRA